MKKNSVSELIFEKDVSFSSQHSHQYVIFQVQQEGEREREKERKREVRWVCLKKYILKL